MCPLSFTFPLMHKAVVRKEIRWKRIYAFAAHRLAEAKTPSAYRFWQGVMDRCVKHTVDWAPLTSAELQAFASRLPK